MEDNSNKIQRLEALVFTIANPFAAQEQQLKENALKTG
jgi:hypothetical protein